MNYGSMYSPEQKTIPWGYYKKPWEYPIKTSIYLINEHLNQDFPFVKIAILFGCETKKLKAHYKKYKNYRSPDVYKQYLVELHKAGLI